MRIYRITKDGKKWPISKENGWYVLGDPKHGSSKHKVENAVKVASEAEVIELLRKGYSVRVETPTRPSLVRRNLYIDGVALV
ncbi:hypothetical protein [Aphanothece microscopica]|uniref:hypothetical protein n=1 Tax=Aphanothece microscopica TaxID=1049561 RepID=UPI003985207B